MRLLRVYIDGYRNLKDVTVDFDKDSLTTVVIGENGSGKSNLIEAIVEVFRAWDLGEQAQIRFNYDLRYRLNAYDVRLTNQDGLKDIPPEFKGQPAPDNEDGKIHLNVRKFIDSRTSRIRALHLPDLIFGYYSGSSRRFESLFDDHQKAYYKEIIKNDKQVDFDQARSKRRLFFCRPIHGTFALLSQFVFLTPAIKRELEIGLKITGFHSALAHFKQPSWFNYNRWRRENAKGQKAGQRGRASHADILQYADDHWLANGPAGACIANFRAQSFFPLTVTGKVVDDYRRNPKEEGQLACFLRNGDALEGLRRTYKDDGELFAALEAADISDLFREMIVWVTRTNDDTGDISFSDLSDGERQLLMVLGLIRVSRGKEALFLLDEPDTHLNPAWQLTYLDLIREWTEVAADEDKCQIIMTTHNPLTIAALEAKEVRVMSSDEDGNVTVEPPRIDPRGLGFAGVLTDIFGLSSSLDKPTQQKIDRRNELAAKANLTPELAKEFGEIKEELRHFGFLYEERDKLYSEFLRRLKDVELAKVDPLTPEELREREKETRRIVEDLMGKK